MELTTLFDWPLAVPAFNTAAHSKIEREEVKHLRAELKQWMESITF